VVERGGLENQTVIYNYLSNNNNFQLLINQHLTNINAFMRNADSRHRKSEVNNLGRGYPDTLQVFRMPASKYWYVGMYLPSRGRFVKKSTKCEKLNDAKVVAADWYEDRIVEKRTHHASSGMSFAIYSEKFDVVISRRTCWTRTDVNLKKMSFLTLVHIPSGK
jgi:hypothetical protein